MSGSGSPRRADTASPSRLTRRGFLLGGGVVIAVAGLGGAQWFNVAAQVSDTDLTAPQAHDAVQAGRITLVDIRRPDEWARTGIGEGAVPIDMRASDFIDQLLVATQGRTDVPVALICARGVRSNRMSNRLRQAGFTQIIDVPEGMLGSGAGPGWLKRGLPTTTP